MAMHPHGEKLSAYIDGMLDVAQTSAVARHLQECDSCRKVCAGLEQARSLLRAMPIPPPPAPQFWTDLYRQVRVSETQRPAARRPLGEVWRAGWRHSSRRWAAGVTAAAVLAGVLVSPFMRVIPGPPPVAPVDSVDVSSLVRAHTASVAHQPLADPDRQAIISADTDAFFLGDEVNPEAVPGGTNGGDALP